MKSFDLSDKPSPKRRTSALERMENLRAGVKGQEGEFMHDHSGYRTTFSTWLAQQRVRLGRPFKGVREAPNSNLYRITVPHPDGLVVEAQATRALES